MKGVTFRQTAGIYALRLREILKEAENNYLVHRWYNKHFDELVANRVRRHIEILEQGKEAGYLEKGHAGMYALIRKEYEDNYCPPCLMHEWLNWENQERYFDLRCRIDEALDDSAHRFSG